MDIEVLRASAQKEGFTKFSVGVIIAQGNHILIVQRSPTDFLGGFFELPGGGIEPGESVVDAVARETREETGLDVITIGAYIGPMDYRSSSGKLTRQFTVVAEVLLAPIVLSSEHTAFRWITDKDAPDAGLTPETLHLVRLYFARFAKSTL